MALLRVADGSTYFVKIGTGADAGVLREGAALRDIRFSRGFGVPSLVAVGRCDRFSYLVTEAELGTRDGLSLPLEAVADLVGDIVASGSGPHGDLTPWNVRVRLDGALVVVDWEDKGVHRTPLFDLVSYVVHCGSALRLSDPRTAAARLSGDDGLAGRCLRRAGLVPDAATTLDALRRALDEYVEVASGPERIYAAAVRDSVRDWSWR